MPIPKNEKDSKPKQQSIAHVLIKGAIARMRKKLIMIIIGSGLISYSCGAGANELVNSNSFAGSILYMLGAGSGFIFLYFCVYICSDFRRYSRDALDDWKKFLENEEGFWAKHIRLKKIPWN